MRALRRYAEMTAIQAKAVVCNQGIGLAFVWAVQSRFDDVGGWTLTDIAFLYGMRLTAHGLWVTPFGQIHGTDYIVREGGFDRFLVRPLNPLLEQIARRLNFMAVGDLVGGITLLALVSVHADVDWSPAAIACLVLAVAGAALLEVAIQLAFTAYFPATVMLNRTNELSVPVGSPSAHHWSVCCSSSRRTGSGSRHYSSAGS